MHDAPQHQPYERAEAARPRHDQIAPLLVRNLRDHMRRATRRYVRQLERCVETFLLKVLDLLPDRSLDLVLIENDWSGGPAERELVYVHDDEPGSVSLREALGERERLLSSARAVCRPDDHLEHHYLHSVRQRARDISRILCA